MTLRLSRFWFCGFFVACNGGSLADNPAVLDYEGTECKSSALVSNSQVGGVADKQTESGPITSQLRQQAPRLEGLSCVGWEREEDVLKLDLRNIGGACMVLHEGEIMRLEDGRLELNLVNQYDGVAGCGSCLYDYAFRIDAPGPITELIVTTEDLPDQEPEQVAHLRLEGESGVACRDESTTYEWKYRACGAENQACGGSDAVFDPDIECDVDVEGDGCGLGLVCATGTGDRSHDVCRRPCDQDADCGAEGTLVCREGACGPAETGWL